MQYHEFNCKIIILFYCNDNTALLLLYYIVEERFERILLYYFVILRFQFSFACLLPSCMTDCTDDANRIFEIVGIKLDIYKAKLTIQYAGNPILLEC